MFKSRPTYAGCTLVLGLALLAGCAKTSAPTTAPQAPAPASLTAIELPADATTGRVELRVQGLGGYKLQATTAQVASLRVTLTGGALEAPQIKTVSAAQLTSGTGTIAFEDLPPGAVNVMIQAQDAASNAIGSKSAVAIVAKGQTAVVAVALKLSETHVSSEVGGLAVDVTVSDGDVIVDPVASPSPRPSSNVLSPAPSATPTATPTPAGTVSLVGDVTQTWYSSGRMAVSGEVKNTWNAGKRTRVIAAFYKKGILRDTLVETITKELGTINANSSTTFAIDSSSSVKSSLFGDGYAKVTVEVY